MKCNEKTFILIDGWWGSGKSTLRGLLDGHPELFVCPIQDSLPGQFSHDPQGLDWLKHREVVGLRRCLGAGHGYYRIERFAYNQGTHVDSSRRDRIQLPFDFDFSRFDGEWVKALMQEPEWTAEGIVHLIYQSFVRYWKDYPLDEERLKGYVSMDTNYPFTVQRFYELFPNSKFLHVKRDLKGIFATRVKRKPIEGASETTEWDTFTVRKLVSKGEIRNIRRVYRQIDECAAKYPENFLVVDFEPLVEQTADTMKTVADFLGIEYLPSLEVFSYCGVEQFSSSGSKFVGKINDRPDELLESSDRILIELQDGRRSLFDPVAWKNTKAMFIHIKLTAVHYLEVIFNKILHVINRAGTKILSFLNG